MDSDSDGDGDDGPSSKSSRALETGEGEPASDLIVLGLPYKTSEEDMRR